MAKYQIGQTVYIDPYFAQSPNARGVDEGLGTVLNPTGIASAANRTAQGYYRVQYHKDKKQHRWIHKDALRTPLPHDFQVDDIIRETTLGIYDLKIIEIHTVSLTGGNAPIEAEVLDDFGVPQGSTHFLEPEECILIRRGKDSFHFDKEPEPKNNDGRYPNKRCWWCDGKLKVVPGFNYFKGSKHQDYHVCTLCGK